MIVFILFSAVVSWNYNCCSNTFISVNWALCFIQQDSWPIVQPVWGFTPCCTAVWVYWCRYVSILLLPPPCELRVLFIIMPWNLQSNMICFFKVGAASPKLDILTGSTLDRPVGSSSAAAPAPPAPVGHRIHTGAISARPTSINAESQKPPDLLEQRRGKYI